MNKRKDIAKLITRQKREKTILKMGKIEGISASNEKAILVFEPAEEGEGINFYVEDIIIAANFTCIKIDPNKHTTKLEMDKIELEYIEHLMAAIAGLGIDNLRIYLEKGCQIPFFDGSSFDYAEKLIGIGIKNQKKRKSVVKICDNYEIKDEMGGAIRIRKSKDNILTIRAKIQFNPPIGLQFIEYNHSPLSFCLGISWARTFGFKEFKDKETTIGKFPGFWKKIEAGQVFSNMIIYKDEKYITQVHRIDEPVRHKILDFLGDIKLLGCDLEGEIDLVSSGHKLNHELLNLLSNTDFHSPFKRHESLDLPTSIT